MVSRIVIAGAVIAALFLWLGPFSVPNWAVIGFVFVVLFPSGYRSQCEAAAPGEPPGTYALSGSDGQIAFLQPTTRSRVEFC